MTITSNLDSDLPAAPHRPDVAQPIVIADAEEDNAAHVERQLRRSGVKNPVVTFHNGDDLHLFLADAAQKDAPAPCVLFLDPRMPGANGYDPVRWVRREKGGREILVAIFSTPDQPDEREVAGELGIQLFLKKHPDLAGLAPVIELLGGTLPAGVAPPELPPAPVK